MPQAVMRLHGYSSESAISAFHLPEDFFSRLSATSSAMPDETENPHQQTRAPQSAAGVAFPATQWSMILRVQREGPALQGAMNDFCRRYWYPIYAYLRSRGFERPEAQDITQSFFLEAVSGDLIRHAEQGRGRLRSFLLGALSRHLADHLRHEKAAKRGGRVVVLPIECYTAEEKFSAETTDYRDPESLFLSAWARSLLDDALAKVRKHYADSGRAAMFDALQPYLSLEEKATRYDVLAQRLNTTESNLRLNVHRMRQRFAKLLRDAVAETVETSAELEEELAWLSGVLRDG